uniref:UDP-glucuronosyltransferase 321H1 n=1 Tax=Lissorhoptrus oryzophilus TaxID=308863 RepID=A0A2R4FXG6_9CUCU|nr:UDP-glucuronosyltransferase 321H1 [Lissorhoptrus oryzophilus]
MCIMKIYLNIFCILLTSLKFSETANILAIIPTPSFSHQIPFRSLWTELSLKGHNVTLVTTDPIKNSSLTNLHEIDISYAYKYVEKYKYVEIASDDTKSNFDILKSIRGLANETNHHFFQSPEGQNLIHNKDNKFDLLIVEAQLPVMMVFSWHYKIPFIGVSSLDCSLQYHDSAGNPTHPVINPDPNQPVANLQDMTFWERLQSFILINIYRIIIYFDTLKRETNILKIYFGDDVPPLVDIQNNISMLFISMNPIFQSIRPLMPNTISLGNGMHIFPNQTLPKDIKHFLDGARQGAIYFSLGSNVKCEILNINTKAELLKAFKDLPYKVLWRTDNYFENLPKNVMVQKWLPQQGVLEHPNIKLFITQGGLQSMQESIYYDKPMIGISFFGDQHANVQRMVVQGFGIHLSKNNITKESVTNAIKEIMNNPRYTEKAKQFGKIIRDVDMPNIDKAIWWTEYVIRHKGAKHFRSPTVDMPFWKYYLLDVIGFFLGIIYVIYNILKIFFKLLIKFFRIFYKKGTHKKEKTS